MSVILKLIIHEPILGQDLEGYSNGGDMEKRRWINLILLMTEIAKIIYDKYCHVQNISNLEGEEEKVRFVCYTQVNHPRIYFGSGIGRILRRSL